MYPNQQYVIALSTRDLKLAGVLLVAGGLYFGVRFGRYLATRKEKA